MYRPFSNCLVSALAKSRAASRLVRTMAGHSRNKRKTKRKVDFQKFQILGIIEFWKIIYNLSLSLFGLFFLFCLKIFSLHFAHFICHLVYGIDTRVIVAAMAGWVWFRSSSAQCLVDSWHPSLFIIPLELRWKKVTVGFLWQDGVHFY